VHLPLTKETLAAHAAVHFADSVSASLTKMASFHEQTVLFAEALYQYQIAIESFKCNVEALQSNRVPISISHLLSPESISDMGGFLKSNDFYSIFLPWSRRTLKNHADAKLTLADFEEAYGQLMEACARIKDVFAKIGALELAFASVSRFHHFCHHFFAKVRMQVSRQVLGATKFQKTVDAHNVLFSDARSSITIGEDLVSSVQTMSDRLPAEAHEKPELSSASLPNDALVSPIYSPSVHGSGQESRCYIRSVSPVFRPPISISGCLDAVARAISAEEFLNARQYLMLAAVHFEHAASKADLAWMLLSGRECLSKNAKTAFELVEFCGACPHSRGVLALCLYRGQGVAMDKMRAVPLARQSAAAGSRYGQFALACYYHDEQDSANAIANYKLSAEQGLNAAYYELGCISQLANSLEEAAALFTRAADQGFCVAYIKLADIADNEMERANWHLRSRSFEDEARFRGVEEADGSASSSSIPAYIHSNCVDNPLLFKLDNDRSSNGSNNSSGVSRGSSSSNFHSS
jgi:hypothetical protein